MSVVEIEQLKDRVFPKWLQTWYKRDTNVEYVTHDQFPNVMIGSILS